MRDYIDERLKRLRNSLGRTPRLAIVNTGGTLLCLPNEEGQFEPVKTEEELMRILENGSDFNAYINEGLLELNVPYHKPKDSSQMLDKHREPFLPPMLDAYSQVDGFLMVHGTDTAPQTTRFLHLTLPYFNPIAYWQTDRFVTNWTKPVYVVSSQEPAGTLRNGEIIPVAGSDADVNLIMALSLFADNEIGETGILTNGSEALRGVISNKVSESHVPAFAGDKGVPKIAERTAFGLDYPSSNYQRTRSDGTLSPVVIMGSAEYERRVLLVEEDAHLECAREFIDAKEQGLEQLVNFKREYLPRVMLYVSRGAGNVQEEHYEVLKKMEDEGVLVARVPIPGGRVPKKMHYAVPGADILGLNIEKSTARYKAQTVLALEKRLGIEQGRRRQFFEKMMQFEFGNEMLPYN